MGFWHFAKKFSNLANRPNSKPMQSKADLLVKLQNDILCLQGFKPAFTESQSDFGLGRILHSFPTAFFPIAGVHEFICAGQEEATASGAFVASILSSSMNKGGVSVWVGSSRLVFPSALQLLGVAADKIIFIDLKREKDVLWVVEEALKCNALTAVVGEICELDFTASRRFQLVIENSGVGCFLLRRRPRNLATASLTRWQIQSLPSNVEDDLPGVGHPRWQVNLLKVRNGKPGNWEVEWVDGKFRHPSKLSVINSALQKKVI